MRDDDLSPDQIAAATAFVDIEAPPPDEPVALVLFGTNQAQPAAIAAARYHRGLAPLVITTGESTGTTASSRAACSVISSPGAACRMT
jgi:hypothetical protein